MSTPAGASLRLILLASLAGSIPLMGCDRSKGITEASLRTSEDSAAFLTRRGARSGGPLLDSHFGGVTVHAGETAIITIVSAECAGIGDVLTVSGTLSGTVSTDACRDVGATLVVGPAGADGFLEFVLLDQRFGSGTFLFFGNHPNFTVLMEDGFGDGDFNDAVLSVTLVTSCEYSVTPLSQGGSDWATEQYDHLEGKTIQNKGCALTALTMALNFAGYGDIDPAGLNDYLKDNGGFAPRGRVRWDVGANQRPASLTLKWREVPSTTSLGGLARQLCAGGHPIVVGVKLDSKGTPRHFVLATGVENGRIKIADPGNSSRLFLDDPAYDNNFRARGSVVDPPGDIRALYFSIDDAEMHVVDPAFGVTGRLFFNNSIVEIIPHSAYYVDALDDDVTGEPDPSTTSAVYVFQPLAGVYEVRLQGTTSGTHTLVVHSYAPDGTRRPSVEIPVVLTAEEIAVVTVSPFAIVHVDVDIKPGTFPNPINPASNGVIPVAILTTPTFDAATVDVPTVRFGAAADTDGNGALEDVDGDGDVDVLLHFLTQHTFVECDDDEVMLSGRTVDGGGIEGSDSIQPVGCH